MSQGNLRLSFIVVFTSSLSWVKAAFTRVKKVKLKQNKTSSSSGSSSQYKQCEILGGAYVGNKTKTKF